MSRRCELTDKGAQTGNNVSHALNRTKKRFDVNLQNVTLASDILGQSIKVKIATSTLRSIDHNGGLDTFLTTTSNGNLSDLGVKLKKKIKKTVAAIEAKKTADKKQTEKKAA